jgi:flagellin
VDTNTYLSGTTTLNTVGGFEDSSAFAKAAAINAQSSSTGVTATASTGITGAAPTGTNPLTAGDIYINGYAVGSALAGATTVQSSNNVATAINSISANTGVTASVNSSSGLITLNATDGRNINVAANVNGKAMLGLGQGAAFAGNSPISSEYNNSYGNLVLNSSVNFAITTTGTGTTAAGLNSLSQTFNGLSNIDLTTQSNASTALTTLDAAIQQVDTQRGNLGAIQNRFQLTVNNLSQGSINLQTSRSRIQDTDFAAQTAALSQSQILQQAGTAMLTQANTLPNSVLALLKG